MTAALEGGEWSAARPGRTLPPGKTRYPLYRRLGGPLGRSGRVKNLVRTGIRSQTVQPVAQSLHRLSYPVLYAVRTAYLHIFCVSARPVLPLASTLTPPTIIIIVINDEGQADIRL